MRYCYDCKKKFKEEDAKIVEYQGSEVVGEGDFKWENLRTVTKKIDVCPQCKGINHACVLEESEPTDKWFWMMDYCKKKSIPPAQKWAWDEAGDEYYKKFEL